MYKTRHAVLFLTIPMLLFLVFTLLPAVGALGLSFTNYNVFAPLEWVGIDNYVEVLQDEEFWSALGVTVYFWLLVTPILVIFPIFVAVLANQKVKGIRIFRLVFYFPVLVSVVVTAILWRWMFNVDGILNYFLGFFGLPQFEWLTSPEMVVPSMALVTIWSGFGYYTLFYLAGLQSIPKDLYEAADLDGAGFFQKHFLITIPLLRPVIFFVAVISTMGAFKEFTLMLTMTDGGPLGASTTVVLLVFKEAFQNLNMGYASSMSFILFLFILILTLINQKLIDRNPDR
ncbi:sugar ABC transporter permease [Bacillaceae bacterium SIJ1]|uniref:carbohydrate ABC transporter permease n=1 Tax=Litoribacterium kuwaitense TaxID=1398745 RepID=UPI0013EB497E|nr:sugar ABC transporter permease [Litoribacterium kuwaitense]NGP46370.1 sugar ABC transporter permease [Litoribacterium kuwaitense]